MKFTLSLLSVCVLSFILFYSCSKENNDSVEVQFICTVDYVEFTSDVTANVKFDVIVDGKHFNIKTEALNHWVKIEIGYINNIFNILVLVDGKIKKHIMLNDDNKKKFISYKNCGQEIGEYINEDFIKKINNLPCGEVIFNSIDNDGNGSGVNLELVELLINLEKPLLLMGGAGKPEHISKTLKLEKVSGVVTANLFNFLGTGLKKAREECIADGIKLPIFEQEI